MNTIGAVLALFALLVAVIAYRAGYRRGDAELRRQRQPTDVTLPRWRRVAGWAAYTCSGLLLCLFLFLAFRHAKGWGWIGLLGAWALWFALFMAGIWLAEWCWRPYREAQERRRHEQTEILRALEGRANKKNST